jgi:hypothetical protein
MIDREANGIVKRGTCAWVIILGLKVLDLRDGFAVADELDASRLEGHEGDILLLLGIFLLCAADGLEGFVDTGEGLTLDAAHGATLVEDDEVEYASFHFFFGF